MTRRRRRRPRTARRGRRHQPRRPARPARGGRRTGARKSPAAPAAPSVRRLARELGVDIRLRARHRPRRSHQHRRRPGIRAQDGAGRRRRRRGAARRRRRCPTSASGATVERKPMSNIRRKTAEHLATPGSVIPHVTQHDKADITALEALRKRYGAAGGEGRRQADGHRDRAEDRRRGDAASSRSSTRRSISRASEIVYKKSMHIGVAVDTAARPARAGHPRRRPEGHRPDLAEELAQASEKARAGKLVARRHAGRRLHDHQPRRHRRHVVHADRQLAGSRDPRHVARRAWSRCSNGDRRVRAAADAAAVAVLRSPRDRRRRRARASCAGSCEAFEQPFVHGALRHVPTVRAPRTSLASQSESVCPIIHTLVVIGAGPGGYAAAFYAADLGMQVTLVDPEQNPGGVCLYRGCIPSKALLHVAKLIDEAKHADAWGVTLRARRRSTSTRLRGFKEKVVDQLTGGLGQLAEAAQDHLRPGAWPRSATRSTLEITDDGGETGELDVRARDHRHRIAAGDGAGPVDRQPARDGLDRRARAARHPEDRCWSSAAATSASSWAASTPRSASKVTVVEMTDGLLPGADRDLVNILAKRIETICEAVLLKTKVVGDEGGRERASPSRSKAKA